MIGEAMETSASFEARYAPPSYPTAKQRTYGSVRGVSGNRYPYRDRYPLRRAKWKFLVTMDPPIGGQTLCGRLVNH
jgi:hypothetical protein